jgi:hypothetical protein
MARPVMENLRERLEQCLRNGGWYLTFSKIKWHVLSSSVIVIVT